MFTLKALFGYSDIRTFKRTRGRTYSRVALDTWHADNRKHSIIWNVAIEPSATFIEILSLVISLPFLSNDHIKKLFELTSLQYLIIQMKHLPPLVANMMRQYAEAYDCENFCQISGRSMFYFGRMRPMCKSHCEHMCDSVIHITYSRLLLTSGEMPVRPRRDRSFRNPQVAFITRSGCLCKMCIWSQIDKTYWNFYFWPI